MSLNLRDFTKAAYTFDAVVQRVPADAWDRRSPCEEWSAREVLGHVVWAMQRIAAGALGADTPAERPEAESAGDDPASTWTETMGDTLAALDRQGVLDRTVTASFGTATIDAMLGFYPADLLAHAWDIATTAGLDAHLPADLCERFAVGIAAAGDGVRGPGRMGEPVAVASDADAATRFVAQTGRTP
jgi:uncharacterized protein (TIGR03086 family)